MSTPVALILGADGFIGRHIAFDLRAAGWTVIASAQRIGPLKAMGFEVHYADLADKITHQPGFWMPVLDRCDAVINCAGILGGDADIARHVHETAPRALYEAMAEARPGGMRGVLLSAVGIDDAATQFAKTRRAGEAVALASGITVLRAGLVLGDTSFGGSSMIRGLAAAPLVSPVIGDGAQPFDPIHASDLALVIRQLLDKPAVEKVLEIGGPDTVSQAEMIQSYRAWLGLPVRRILRLPLLLARVMGRLGDLMSLGPISSDAVAQLQAGVKSDVRKHPQGIDAPRGFSVFHKARPAGTQDLWHARLYLMRPALRLVLAFMWLASGILGLLLPTDQFLPLITADVPDTVLVLAARLGGIVDIGIGMLMLRGRQMMRLVWTQMAMIGAYTLAFTALAPALWLLPLGGLLKNIPLLVLVALQGVLERER